MQKYRITQQEINENNVKSAADLLRGDAQSNKNVFDRLPELIAERLNKIIDNVYSKLQVDSLINNKIVEIGSADMAKAIYDKDNDGVVDDSAKLGGMPAEYYAARSIAPYTQSGGTLSGSGENGKFKSTTTGTYTAFTIDGVSYAVKAGCETEIELVKDAWYSFILDTEAKTVNFKQGGAGLNFKIVGGTTQPVSPKENTIWINTDADIGEWVFSAVEPTTRADGTDLQVGDVWLKTDWSREPDFNALKKNGIHIHLVQSYQYENGSWVKRSGSIYKNNAWKEFSGHVTVLDTSINAPIETWNFKIGSAGSSSGRISAEEGLVIKVSSGTTTWVSVKESVLRDFSKFSKLEVHLSKGSTNSSTSASIAIASSSDAFIASASITGGAGTYSLDLSDYNDKGFVSVYAEKYADIIIDKIILYT